jgi:glycosyltransferase involved in cell wall biosynthesis
MPNILHVVNNYFVIPYFIGDQFIHFGKKGYRFFVVCSPSPHLETYSIKMGFNYYEVEILKAITPIKDIRAMVQISRFIKRNKIDIVIGHTPKGALLSMFVSYIMKVPKRIYFRHGLVYETSHGFKKSLLKKIEKVTAFCSTIVVCVSPSVYEVSLKDKLNRADKQLILGRGTCGGIDTLYKFNPENINNSELEELRIKLKISKRAYVVGYCGRLVRDKGIYELVQAFDLLRERYPEKEFCLLLVGMFEDRDALSNETVKKINVDTGIVNTGYINDSIEYYYALMNLLVLPSYREGFGMSVIEASSMKKPVLTTRATGCVDAIVESVTGSYIKNDPVSILSGIEYYYNNETLAVEHGLNGRKFVVENFEQQKMWVEIEGLY